MAKELVSIKGTRDGLVILYDPSREFEDIKLNLKHKIESARGFFKGAKVNIYNGPRPVTRHQKAELENICRHYGLIPSNDIQWPPALIPHKPQNQIISQEIVTNIDTDAPSIKTKADIPGEPALLTHKTLRSGQVITHSGHVIVFGNVHSGAEIVASGNIVIVGDCTGTVHAGAGGNKNATVTALRLNPIQLRIAGVKAPNKETGRTAFPQCARLNAANEVSFEPWFFSRAGRE